jgi:hypothetical protein
MICHPEQHGTTILKAWNQYIYILIRYITWICKTFSESDMRYFLVLEYFTRSSMKDKNYSNDDLYLELWLKYLSKCGDGNEIFNFMKSNDLCTTNYLFYDSFALFYEKMHDFKRANSAYVEGLERRIDNPEALKKKYYEYEERMKKRIQREIHNSVCDKSEIERYIRDEYSKKQMMKSDRKMFYEDNTNIQKFKYENSYSTADYGSYPIFVDEPFRKNIIREGTVLTDKYLILLDYLIKMDEKYQIQHSNYQIRLGAELKNKPVSWTNVLRVLPEKIENVEERPQERIEKFDKVEKQDKLQIQDKLEKQEKHEKFEKTIFPQKLIPKNDTNSIIKEEERNGEKYRIVKVDQPKKITKLFMNPDTLFKNNKYTTITELRCKWYVDKLQANQRRRKTIVIKVDSDGDVIMSSDEETKPQVNIKPNKPVINNKSTEKININLFNQEMTFEQIQDQVNKIDKLSKQGTLSEVEKNKMLQLLDDKIRHLEIKKENPFIPKPKQNDIQSYLEPTKQEPKNPELLFSNVSRSLDFTNIKIENKENINKKPISSLFLFEEDKKNNDIIFGFDTENSFIDFGSAQKQDDMKFKVFNIKDTPKLMKTKEQDIKPLKNNFTEKTSYTDFTNVNSIPIAEGDEDKMSKLFSDYVKSDKSFSKNPFMGLSFITERTENTEDSRSMRKLL